MEGWRAFQHEVGAFYRSLGMTVEVDATRVEGVRGRHDVDVLVRKRTAGMDVTWVIECKQWKRPVSKEHVMALRAIVDDHGVDRGILVSESGFQAGAYRAAVRSNITLTSLTDLRENAAEELAMATLAPIAARSTAAASRVGRLWRWCRPSLQANAIDVEEMLEAAAPSFEVQAILIPRLHDSLSEDGPASRELQDIVAAKLDEAETSILRLEEKVRSASVEAVSVLDELRATVEDLLRIGPDTQQMTAANEFVAKMRRIDELASKLIQSTPEDTAQRIRRIMRHLIDGVYLMPERDAAEHEWEQQRVAVSELTEDALRSLMESVPRQRS